MITTVDISKVECAVRAADQLGETPLDMSGMRTDGAQR